MAVLEPTKGGYYLWHYLPSIPAAVIFLLLFFAATSVIVIRMIRTRTWFCLAFAIGGFLEFAGYGVRASAHNRTSRILPYAVQNLFILLGPILFAASIYVCLGRLIRTLNASHHSILSTRWLTRTFVSGDLLSLVVQGGASGIMVTGKYPTLAQAIVIFGLLIQVIMFGAFMIIALIFRTRINKLPTDESSSNRYPWKTSLRILFSASGLIMFRSIFRVIEFAMGNSGYLLKTEWPLYIFDSVPLVVVMVAYGYYYPSWMAESAKLDRYPM